MSLNKLFCVCLICLISFSFGVIERLAFFFSLFFLCFFKQKSKSSLTMFEATLAEASVLKKVLDAIKDLVTEANFDCNTEGISLQAMDTSRVALVSFFLQADGFAEYRCDRPLSLGINLNSLCLLYTSPSPRD